MKPAVFLDRDGTLIEHVHYLSDPADVQLVRDAARSVQALRAAGYLCVIVTNQSAVGRGLLSLGELHSVHDEVSRQLFKEGAIVDGWYFCPVVPLTDDRTVVEHPDRKPGPGMLLRAAREMSIDLHCSWIIGDMISDALAGQTAGCKARILLRTGNDVTTYSAHPAVSFMADDLPDAARLILAWSSRGEARSSIAKTESLQREAT